MASSTERPLTNDDVCDWSFLRNEYCGGPCHRASECDPDLLEANKQ